MMRSTLNTGVRAIGARRLSADTDDRISIEGRGSLAAPTIVVSSGVEQAAKMAPTFAPKLPFPTFISMAPSNSHLDTFSGMAYH